jgi:hypothetical protein
MKPVRRFSRSVLPRSTLPDGLLPVALLFVIAASKLAYFAWRPSVWGVEESLALAFALGAGYLLTHYIGRSDAGEARAPKAARPTGSETGR